MSASQGSGPFGIWQTWQQLQQNVAAILKVLGAGLIVQPTPVNYLVANLPATAANGQFAFASNGRKPTEGAGLGTGTLVYFNSATGTWFTTLNVVVTS